MTLNPNTLNPNPESLNLKPTSTLDGGGCLPWHMRLCQSCRGILDVLESQLQRTST